MLNTLADAIHFDDNLTKNGYSYLLQYYNVKPKIKNLWQYFHRCSKDSKHYQIIFGKSYQDFLHSPFGENLKSYLSLLENIKYLHGEENSPKVRILLAQIVYLAEMVAKMFNHSVGSVLNLATTYKLIVLDYPDNHVQIKFEPGNSCLKIGMAKHDIYYEVYLEVDGDVRKVDIPTTMKVSLQTFYIRTIIGHTIKIAISPDEECQYTFYKDVILNGEVLDLSQGSEITSIDLPRPIFVNSKDFINKINNQVPNNKFPLESPIVESESAIDITAKDTDTIWFAVNENSRNSSSTWLMQQLDALFCQYIAPPKKATIRTHL